MSGKIKLKRGNSANFGALILDPGEAAFTLDTCKLYVGNGTDKVLINPDIAKKLETSRSIALTGDATGSVNFDGSANVSITTTLKDSGVTAGSGYSVVNVDSKGRVTSGRAMTTADVPNLTLAKITDSGTCAGKNVGTSAGQVPMLNASGKLEDGVIPKTDLVQSINGKQGVVTMSKTDVGLGNVANESKATMFTSPVFTGAPTAPTQPVVDSSTNIATTAWVKSQGFLTTGSIGDIDGGIF